MYKSDFEIKKELCEIGRRIYNDGFVAANDGNFSVKIDDNNYYVTPTGVSKGFMTPEMICKVDGQGNIKEANGPWKPSSEFKKHLKVYQQRPDVNAVVHAHPPIATSFAIAGIPLDKLIMPEAQHSSEWNQQNFTQSYFSMQECLAVKRKSLAVKLRNLLNLESNSAFRVSTLWKSFVRVVMKVTILAQCHRQRLMKSTA